MPLSLAHAASPSTMSIRRAVTTYTRPPSRRVGSSPDAAYRYAEARLIPKISAALVTEISAGRVAGVVLVRALIVSFPPFTRLDPQLPNRPAPVMRRWWRAGRRCIRLAIAVVRPRPAGAAQAGAGCRDPWVPVVPTGRARLGGHARVR